MSYTNDLAIFASESKGISNSVIANTTITSISVGNSSINVSTNSTVLSVGSLSINSSGTTTNTFQIGTGTYFVANGNVGISNTAPDAKLTVTGTANISGNVVIGGVSTLVGNVILGTTGLSANGGFGTAGHTLHSNGTATYWAADDQGVTSVATGNGLTGGTITSTGTISVIANNGLSANATGVYVVPGNGLVAANATGVHVGQGTGIVVNSTAVAVLPNTGIVANATGVYVNSAYIATIASNSATYANASISNTFTVGTANFFASTGNLGVCVTSPERRLHVARLGTSGGSYPTTDASTTAIFSAGPGANGSSSIVSLLSGNVALGGIYFGDTESSTIGRITYDHSDNALKFWTNSSQRMLIDSSGNLGIGATSPAATLDVRGTYSLAGANALSQTLTDAATISWNTALGQIATVTLAGNRTFGGPTNLKIGTYVLNIIQDGVGGRTGDFSNTVFKFPGGVDPVLTTTAGARDIIFFYSDGTNLYGSFLPDVR